MKNRITLLNIISSIFLQLITIISYFVIPKIILVYFGSEVNGLVSSLNQFLNYITLIEGGVSGVIAANLYKPIISGDTKKISSIYNTADSFYKKIGLIYFLYSIVLAIVYPLFFKTSFNWTFVFSLTLILSINLLVQYMFSLSYKTILNADKKGYIISFNQSIIITISIILAYISIKIFPSIHLLKLVTGVLYFGQPLIYCAYFKKNYNIDKNAKKDMNLIKQRWNGFAINLAAFIHLSTDISILTIFTDFATVSIYSVYSLVTNGLRQIIISISGAISPTLGQAYASGNVDDINIKLDLYEYIILIIVFFTFSVAILLITPFVMLYTDGIKDANYYQPIFGGLLLLSEALYLIKLPHSNLSYSANKFKEITGPSFIEAIINIVISLLLVKRYGLIGIAIGTSVAMIYRLIFHVYYTSILIQNRKQSSFYKKLIIFVIGSIIGLVISNLFIPYAEYTLVNWIVYAIIYSFLFGVIYLVISIIFFRKEIKYIKKYLIKK